MNSILTIESCIMKREGWHMPPFPTHLGVFECGSIFNINQHYLEAIPTKCHASTIIRSKILISFAVLAKTSEWNLGLGNISTPYISIFSYLIILLHFYHLPITLKQFEY